MSTSPPSSGSKAGERGPTIGVPTRRSACPASRASTTPSAASSTAAGAAPKLRASPAMPAVVAGSRTVSAWPVGPGRVPVASAEPGRHAVQVRRPPQQVGRAAPAGPPGDVLREAGRQRRQPVAVVGGGELGVQQRLGALVEDRAVPDEGEHVLVGSGPVQRGPPQPLGRVEVPRRDVREVVVQRHRTGRVDDAGALDDPVPQHVLAGGDRVEGGAQRGRVEGAAQALGEGGVPAGGGAVEQRHECARAGCVVRAYRGAQPRIDAVTRTVHVAQAFPSSRGAVPKSERAYDTAQPAGSTRAAVRTAHRGTDLGKLAHEIGYRAGASSPSVITRSRPH